MDLTKALEASLALHHANENLQTLSRILEEYGTDVQKVVLTNATQALSYLESSLKDNEWERQRAMRAQTDIVVDDG